VAAPSFARRRRRGDEAAETEVRGTVAQPRTRTGSDRWQAARSASATPGPNRCHRLVGEGATIGKDAGNDLVLDDRFISGKHLRITRAGGRFLVLDHASTNGTWLGSVRVFEAEVPLHTQIHIGETDLVVEPATSARKEPPALAGAGRRGSGDEGPDRSDRAGRALVGRGHHPRRVRHRQGAGRARHPCPQPRAERPFVPVNCAAISKELIESELFGHEKGAFTGAIVRHKGAFEEADGGTLFLDEIGELPPDLQAKLLRALESGEIKRVGASRPGSRGRAGGRGHQPRLARRQPQRAVPRRPLLPPLRRAAHPCRPSAIAAATSRPWRSTCLAQFSPAGADGPFTPAAIARLENHPWPGNVRELRNVVHRRCSCAGDRRSTRRTSPSIPIPPPAAETGAVSSASTFPAASWRSCSSWRARDRRIGPATVQQQPRAGRARSWASLGRRSSSG
jgi:hypothetical protein